MPRKASKKGTTIHDASHGDPHPSVKYVIWNDTDKLYEPVVLEGLDSIPDDEERLKELDLDHPGYKVVCDRFNSDPDQAAEDWLKSSK